MKASNVQNGVAAVEFAIILPFFLFLTFGIIEFSLILYDKAVITNASREAARSAIAFKVPKLNAGEIIAIAEERSNLLISSDDKTVRVTIVPATVSNPVISGTAVSVTVEYDYNFFVLGGLLSLASGGAIGDPLTISATTIMNNE